MDKHQSPYFEDTGQNTKMFTSPSSQAAPAVYDEVELWENSETKTEL